MMPLYFDTVGDTRQNHWTMKYTHSDLQKYDVISNLKLNKYTKYDANLLDRTRDVRQNQ